MTHAVRVISTSAVMVIAALELSTAAAKERWIGVRTPHLTMVIRDEPRPLRGHLDTVDHG